LQAWQAQPTSAATSLYQTTHQQGLPRLVSQRLSDVKTPGDFPTLFFGCLSLSLGWLPQLWEAHHKGQHSEDKKSPPKCFQVL
jgi:hypothetical protein